MRTHFRTIAVLDSNGDQISLYEIRSPILFGLFVRKQLKLCTGEAVERNGQAYVVTSTGERLTRI